MCKASHQEDIQIYLADDWVTTIPDQKNDRTMIPKFMKIHPKSIQNSWKFIPNPSKIDENGAQELSESDLGNESWKRRHHRDENGGLLAPLGRFGVPFGAQRGAKGEPKSSILVWRRIKISKNEAENEASEKVSIFDWKIVRKCESLNVLNPPKCFV